LIGAPEFGTKVEVKNMNSIRNVQRAIEFEIKRQIEVLEAGGKLYQETRQYDAVNDTTHAMRSKEAANDYRYFPEPDLQPIQVLQSHIDAIRNEMPALPSALFEKYTSQYGLSEYDALNLTDSKSIAHFYEEVIKTTKNFKSAANWVMGDVKSFLNTNGIEIQGFPIPADKIATIIQLIDDGKISNSSASQRLFPALAEQPTSDPMTLAVQLNLIQDSNEDSILTFINTVKEQHPDEVLRYQNGEKQLVGFFMGQLMKVSQGKADPKTANQLLRNELEKQ
jgi:aspartyl-tRNA(Asn)/glutamyl-tRNA(Gln) amidotransferase subunit B